MYEHTIFEIVYTMLLHEYIGLLCYNLRLEDRLEEDLPTYMNEHEAEIAFEDEKDNVKIKGLKSYTMNDGRGTIRQISEVKLG